MQSFGLRFVRGLRFRAVLLILQRFLILPHLPELLPQHLQPHTLHLILLAFVLPYPLLLRDIGRLGKFIQGASEHLNFAAIQILSHSWVHDVVFLDFDEIGHQGIEDPLVVQLLLFVFLAITHSPQLAVIVGLDVFISCLVGAFVFRGCSVVYFSILEQFLSFLFILILVCYCEIEKFREDLAVDQLQYLLASHILVNSCEILN